MKLSTMLLQLRRIFISAFALPFLFGAVLPSAVSAMSSEPLGLSAPFAVIVPEWQGSPDLVSRNGKSGVARIGIFRHRLAAWRAWRSLIRAGVEEGKAGRLAKRSLTFGIISMAALLLAWLPVIGGVLLLGAVPMGVLAVVDGLKARRLGSEKNTGLILGIVSISLFVLLMILALMFLVGFLVLMGP